MCRIRCYTALLWVDNQVHRLEGDDAHLAFISQYSGLGQKRTVSEPDFNRLDPWDTHPS